MTSNSSISQAKLMSASGKGNSLELAVEVSELRYRQLFETAQDGIRTALFTSEEPSQHRAAA
jgi:hypothetical protein